MVGTFDVLEVFLMCAFPTLDLVLATRSTNLKNTTLFASTFIPSTTSQGPENSNIDPKWRGPATPPWGLSTRGLKWDNLIFWNIKWVHTVPPKSKLQDPNPQNQNSKIQTPKIKTPRSKPPKSKLQDPNPQNQNSKIQTPKIKTPRSKPPKLQDPNPQNSKIQTPKIKTPRSKPPKSKLQDPNPQNQNSKIQNHDRSPKKNDKYFFRQIISTMSKISKWKSPKKIWELIFSLKIHETGKMNEKKFARVSPRPIGQKKCEKNDLQAMYFFSSLVAFSVVLSFVFLFLGVDKFKSWLAGFNFKTQIKEDNIQIHQHSEQNIKVIKWKSPKRVAKFGSQTFVSWKSGANSKNAPKKMRESFP